MSRSVGLLGALAATLPVPALAADKCPDGWFCDQPPPPAPPPPEVRPSPPFPDRPYNGEPPYYEEAPAPDEIRLERPEDLDWRPPDAARGHARHPSHRRWGLNLHLSHALLGHDSRSTRDSSMGGLGFGFRYRPIPYFAVDSSLEWVWGRDYVGHSRNESAVLLNAMLFFNPRDVVQVYMFGGFGVSEADVRPNPESQRSARYWYLGSQAGIGVDVRVSPRVALSADLLGILRGRVDSRAAASPEFVDAQTHRVTNTSGAGLIRLGATFYW